MFRLICIRFILSRRVIYEKFINKVAHSKEWYTIQGTIFSTALWPAFLPVMCRFQTFNTVVTGWNTTKSR